jgi:hypothetical protein
MFNILALPSVALPSEALPVSTPLLGIQPVIVRSVVQNGVSHAPPDVPTILAPSIPQQHRVRAGRRRPVPIYVDCAERSMPQGRLVQQKRSDGRIALSKRSDSANSTPTPSPRDDAASFSQSPNDPFWTGKENRNFSPATTPEPFVAAFPHNPAAYTGPPPPPSPQARVNRRTPSSTLPPPRNIVLYEILGFDHWNVCKKDILSAWRRRSLRSHPDRVSQQLRDLATAYTQQLNAAKDVLTDRAARRRYHKTGHLPMPMAPV